MINNFKWGCLAIANFQKYQLDHKFLCLLHTNKLPDIYTARSRLRKSPRRVLQTNKHICSNKLTFVLITFWKNSNCRSFPFWINEHSENLVDVGAILYEKSGKNLLTCIYVSNINSFPSMWSISYFFWLATSTTLKNMGTII